MKSYVTADGYTVYGAASYEESLEACHIIQVKDGICGNRRMTVQIKFKPHVEPEEMMIYMSMIENHLNSAGVLA